MVGIAERDNPAFGRNAIDVAEAYENMAARYWI